MAGTFRDGLLEGKVAVVTGGGSGIGRRMAERFAEHGASVMLIGRKQEKLDAAKSRIEAAGGRAATASADVRDEVAVAGAFQKAREQFGLIDIVVAGAAGNFPAPVSAMTSKGFKAVVDIDLLGTFHTVHAAYAHLRRPGASLIAISAIHATQAIAYQAHVCAAKAGVELLMKSLAIEWGPEGVRCNCIVPGPTADTEGMRRLAPTPEIEDHVKQSVPLRRFGTKDELADLAMFLSSDAAAYMTGGVYLCDGGQSLMRSGDDLRLVWEAAAKR